VKQDRLVAVVPFVIGCGVITGIAAGVGCGSSSDEGTGGAGLSASGSSTSGTGGSGNSGPSPCDDYGPTCTDTCVGPDCNPSSEFPMPDDDPPPDNVTADGVTKDEDGYIVLDGTETKTDNMWVADDRNYNVGLVSKIRTKPFPSAPNYREVARYVSVTCHSDPVNGSKEGAVLGQNPPGGLCANQTSGCCARDAVSGAGWAVQLLDNRPSRTAVDLNGDVWVANRAHGSAGHQASVTKIAGDVSRCIERNGNNNIDTSSDVNHDGIITTDCNNDNLPDDLTTQCTGGMAHEFYGLDDECILFTVNLGTPGGTGRPLTLGRDPDRPTGPSDAWAGLYSTGQFFRIDGESGLVEDTVQMQPQEGVDPHPYGAAIDYYEILWAPNVGTPYLFYFDTTNPSQQGMVTSEVGGGFYGIAIDGYSVSIPDDKMIIQQIWMGDYEGGAAAGAIRYRPVRDQGFAGLALGTWAKAVFDKDPNTSGLEVRQARGLGADNRAPNAFVWVALDGLVAGGEAHVGRVSIDIPDSATTTLGPGDMFASTQLGMTGAGVASDLDVWGVNQSNSSVVHYGVDADGNVISGPDVIPLDDKPNAPEDFCPTATICKPHPYTYSDFTGFGLRNFTIPQGYYAWIESGSCPPGDTMFLQVLWDSEEPPDTSITLRARSSDYLSSLSTATWTGNYTSSPADLAIAPGPLSPNPTNHIEVMFELKTISEESPKLKSFQIVYQCETTGPD